MIISRLKEFVLWYSSNTKYCQQDEISLVVTGTVEKSSKILSLKGKDDLTKTVIKSYFVNGLADGSKGIEKA